MILIAMFFQMIGSEFTDDQVLPMTKYCLALVSPQRSETRLRVGDFPVAERAFELAELIALDLSIEADGTWSGWTVEVRSEDRKLFAVPVAGPDLHRLPAALSGPLAPAMGSSRLPSIDGLSTISAGTSTA